MKKPEIQQVQYLGFFEALDYVIIEHELDRFDDPDQLSLKQRLINHFTLNSVFEVGKRGSIFHIPYVEMDSGESDIDNPPDIKEVVHLIVEEFGLRENTDILFKMDW